MRYKAIKLTGWSVNRPCLAVFPNNKRRSVTTIYFGRQVGAGLAFTAVPWLLGCQRIDALPVLSRQLELGRRHVLLEVRKGRRAGNWQHHARAMQEPGQR